MTGPVAVITGAGSGIGRAAAIALANNGYRLALAGRRADALHETAAMLGGAEVICVPTDVVDSSSVDALFSAVVARFCRVEVLFNNAGLALPATPLEDMASSDWNSLISVNVTGMFHCLQSAFRVMKAQDPQGGRIINNGSLSAHVPRLQSIAYTASKHAVTGMTKCAALEGRAYNIAVGQIDIGNATTDLGGSAGKGALQADGSRRDEPMMDVQKAGEAVAYMAGLPLDTNVQTMTIMATAMPYIGRG